MKQTTIKGELIAQTDIGRVRVTNEDQAAALKSAMGYTLLCVCDGMGGHRKGDYASKLAIDIITEEFQKVGTFLTVFSARHWLTRTIKKINTTIYNEGHSSPIYKDMGTTIVVVLLYLDKIIIANVGDSRAYLVRYASLLQLTSDQTYVDYMIRAGKMTEDEAKVSDQRHVLMNAIGTFPSVSIDISVQNNIKNPILLCSDGLYNNASETEIHAALSTNESVEQKVQSLIRIANKNGGSDNIGIAYWEALK